MHFVVTKLIQVCIQKASDEDFVVTKLIQVCIQVCIQKASDEEFCWMHFACILNEFWMNFVTRKSTKTFVNKRWMVSRTVMIRCALESPYLGQLFKYLEPYHIIHRKFFRATWSWKMPQKLTKTQKFRQSQLALKNKN